MKKNGTLLGDTKVFPSFSVDDLTKAKTFYHDTLGLTVKERPEGLELEVGNGNRVFVYPKPDHRPATFTVLNFSVDSIDKAVDTLKSNGVTFEQYDLPQIKTDDRGIARIESGLASACK